MKAYVRKLRDQPEDVWVAAAGYGEFRRYALFTYWDTAIFWALGYQDAIADHLCGSRPVQ